MLGREFEGSRSIRKRIRMEGYTDGDKIKGPWKLDRILVSGRDDATCVDACEEDGIRRRVAHARLTIRAATSCGDRDARRISTFRKRASREIAASLGHGTS